MAGCCDDDCSVDVLQEKQRGTLKTVLFINATMFLVIVAAGLYSRSSSLLADSMDNFGDALTYALSLLVVSKGVSAKARVALFKGLLITLGGCIIMGQVIYKLFEPTTPIFEVMGAFSLLSLVANSVCLYLLWRHRNEDVNMSSVWECSRNDIAVNISVFLTAGAVWLTDSGWPDIIIATCLVILLLRSGYNVIMSATKELKAAR
ncbi:cation transporter [Kangiella sediminilitoris]|uniref:Cation efflux protein n=1 Tax=Kangiella sediminilitoris TaxID=1144748 RepID=A0A1B3B960_9GAMM|nr:cation transporter [Kangiella sediminilitoris]AOE49337.1 Cation efflux protein [Kangiella sediminilitoris]